MSSSDMSPHAILPNCWALVKGKMEQIGIASCWLDERGRPESTILAVGGLLQECPFFQFVECLAELLLRVHHDGAIPRHGLFERLARNQQKADAFFACLYHQLVAATQEHQRTVAGLCGG